MSEDEKRVEGPLPVHLNLAGYPNPREVIGWANIYRKVDGTMRIDISLDEEASSKLTNLAEVFELKALGFAGIKRMPS